MPRRGYSLIEMTVVMNNIERVTACAEQLREQLALSDVVYHTGVGNSINPLAIAAEQVRQIMVAVSVIEKILVSDA